MKLKKLNFKNEGIMSELKKFKGFKRFNEKELKRFTGKVLALSRFIDVHGVKNYIAYRTGTNKNNDTGTKKNNDKKQAFMRLYTNKLTLALPMNEINPKDKEKYSLKDNSSRHPRHELITKRHLFDSQCLEKCFLDLVKNSFKYIRTTSRL